MTGKALSLMRGENIQFTAPIKDYQYTTLYSRPYIRSFPIRKKSVDYSSVHFHIERKKLPNLTTLHKKAKMTANKPWEKDLCHLLFGQVPTCNSLMVRGYQPGREDHEFDPRLGNFFLFISFLILT